MVVLVFGNLEQIHETRRTRGMREKHTCHSDTVWGRDYCLQCHCSRCDKHCGRRFHEDDNISVGSHGENMFATNAVKKSYEVLGEEGNDSVTERECFDSCDTRKERAKHRCRIMGRQTQCSPTNSNHHLSEAKTGRGRVGRKRTRVDSLGESGHACMSRLQVGFGVTRVGDATRKRREWLHLQSERDRYSMVPVCCQTN